jgi:hypothetical protein
LSEFLHETFFQAAIAFFATSAFIIVRVLWSFQAIFDLTAEDETMQVSCAVASILGAPTIVSFKFKMALWKNAWSNKAILYSKS